MQRQYSKRRSREEMAMIVAEFQTGSLSRNELAQKYGLKCPSLISVWQKRLQNRKKSLPLQREMTENFSVVGHDTKSEVMETKEYSSLEEEVKALRRELAVKEKELDWEKKRTMALETLIDVAEKNGMHVKKYGARQ